MLGRWREEQWGSGTGERVEQWKREYIHTRSGKLESGKEEQRDSCKMAKVTKTEKAKAGYDSGRWESAIARTVESWKMKSEVEVRVEELTNGKRDSGQVEQWKSGPVDKRNS